MSAEEVTLVFLEEGLALDKRPYDEWRAVQDAHPSYKTSLGPWTVEELFDYFEHDYAPGEEPFSRPRVEAFMRGDALVLRET